MDDRHSFWLGAVFMAGLLISGAGIHWFISPELYTATSGRKIAVAFQVIIPLMASAWAWYQSRRAPRTTTEGR